MIITPPNQIYNSHNKSVFLAGTIDDGNSEDWQCSIATSLQSRFPALDIYNPRRNDWDAKASKEEISGQIWWELQYLSMVDIVFFNFLPNSKSPVTLLELGLVLGKRRDCVVVVPEEFYRELNVKLTCLYENRLIYSNFDEGYLRLIDKLQYGI